MSVKGMQSLGLQGHSNRQLAGFAPWAVAEFAVHASLTSASVILRYLFTGLETGVGEMGIL